LPLYFEKLQESFIHTSVQGLASISSFST